MLDAALAPWPKQDGSGEQKARAGWLGVAGVTQPGVSGWLYSGNACDRDQGADQ